MLHPHFTELYRVRSSLYIHVGDTKDCLQHDPQTPSNYYQLALNNLSVFLQKHPKDLSTLTNYLKLASKLNRWEEVIFTAISILELDSKNTFALEQLSNLNKSLRAQLATSTQGTPQYTSILKCKDLCDLTYRKYHHY